MNNTTPKQQHSGWTVDGCPTVYHFEHIPRFVSHSTGTLHVAAVGLEEACGLLAGLALFGCGTLWK